MLQLFRCGWADEFVAVKQCRCGGSCGGNSYRLLMGGGDVLVLRCCVVVLAQEAWEW